MYFQLLSSTKLLSFCLLFIFKENTIKKKNICSYRIIVIKSSLTRVSVQELVWSESIQNIIV